MRINGGGRSNLRRSKNTTFLQFAKKHYNDNAIATAYKVSLFGVILVRIFPHSD